MLYGYIAYSCIYSGMFNSPPDLLQHIEFRQTSSEPAPYPVVEWFAHPSPPPPSAHPSPHPTLPSLPPNMLQWPASLLEDKPHRPAAKKGKKVHKKQMKLPKMYIHVCRVACSTTCTVAICTVATYIYVHCR